MIALALLLVHTAAADPLSAQALDTLHQQRVEWMKARRVEPSHGVYLDLRAAPAPPASQLLPFRVQELAKRDGIQILLTDREPRIHNGVLWMLTDPALTPPALPNLVAGSLKPRDRKRLEALARQYPMEFAGLSGTLLHDPSEAPLAPVSHHVLSRELTDFEVRRSLAEGRTYLAEDWLCDTTGGFTFRAVNNQGVFEIGDRVAIQNNTRLEARFPVPASAIRLYRGDELIHEAKALQDFQFKAPGPGAYRLEADLLDGRRWIRTQPIILLEPGPVVLPPPPLQYQDPSVDAIRNLPYVENTEDNKQKLDLYLPKGKTNFPLLVFIHGGSWTSGDRSAYAPIGILFAKQGIGVAIPSYRLMPKNPHPAQVEDVAAAFAWAVKNAKQHGADPQRIYLAGHSAGGHLASLIALDKSLLARHDVDTQVIKGVAALSGVYDVSQLPMFDRKASPIQYVRRDAPPFLITYAQWDYLSLPRQAKELSQALRRSFVATRLLYLPGETHISEVLSMLKPGDPGTLAVVKLIETGQP